MITFIYSLIFWGGGKSRISEARGAKTCDLDNKSHFKVHFPKYQGKLWRGFQNSKVQTAARNFSPSKWRFDKKKFFRLFYWLKTIDFWWAFAWRGRFFNFQLCLFVLAGRRPIFFKKVQKCSVFSENQDLSFFFDGRFHGGVVFWIFSFLRLFSPFFSKNCKNAPFFPKIRI